MVPGWMNDFLNVWNKVHGIVQEAQQSKFVEKICRLVVYIIGDPETRVGSGSLAKFSTNEHLSERAVVPG